MTAIQRPQPLGAFDMPAGLLLIPGPPNDPIRAGLLRGVLPSSWPDSLEGQRLAYEGKIDEAIEWFTGDDSPVGKFNLFVLDPTRIDRADVASSLGEEWRTLVDYAAFTMGLTSIPPQPEGASHEIAALAWAAQAASHLDEGDEEEAIFALREAVDAARDSNPAFVGTALVELSGRLNDLEYAEEAVALLRETDLKAHYAEAVYQRSGLIHGLAIEGRRPLAEAINGYTEALKHLNEKDHRALFARIHMNLGTALLSAPLANSSDNLRAGVAMQSLRTATRLLDPEEDAEEWASSHLNLANALVYAPSTHQRDNLMEAVDLYEKVVRVRTPKGDPLGRARVLSNQANALAHLGLVSDARERFDEAIFLFASNGDEESAGIVRELLSELDLTNEITGNGAN